MPRSAISSNHFSFDQQVADAVGALSVRERTKFTVAFPEWDKLSWEGSWVNAEASKVDPEYTSWAADWIEQNSSIYWEDGEPWTDK